MNSFALRQTRIVYINHTGQVSGAERVLLNMVHGLDKTRYEPFIACPAEGDLIELMDAEEVSCIRIPSIEARFTWRPNELWNAVLSVGKAAIAVRRMLTFLEPDIIHANTVRAGIAVSLATIGTNRKVIWHVHDTLPRHPLSIAIRLLAFLLSRTRIIAVSDAVARAFRGGLPFATRVATLHNGIDLSRFPLKHNYNEEFREKIGVPGAAFLVCAAGQICARKGLLELIKAFERIYQSVPHMYLVIAGRVVFEHEQKYYNELRTAAAASGVSDRVHFTGEVQDVSALLQAADLLVLNSRDEPFGLVLVEAMSSGTPVLATNVGGVPEIVKDAENGWLIEKGDTAGLAERLVQLSQNQALLAKAAETARRETCPRFSLERFQRRLQRLYAELTPEAKLQWNVRNQPAVARDGDE